MPGRDSRTGDIPEATDVPLGGLLHQFQGLLGQRRDGIDHPFDRSGFGDIGVRQAGKDVGVAQPAGKAHPNSSTRDCGSVEFGRN